LRRQFEDLAHAEASSTAQTKGPIEAVAVKKLGS